MRPVLLSLAALLVACGDQGGYRLELDLPTGADTSPAVRLEVDVLRNGCEGVGGDGSQAAPADIVRELGWHMGDLSGPVGDLVPDTYGFHGRLRDIDCLILFSGCTVEKIEEDGEGRVRVPLTATGTAACDTARGQECHAEEGCVVIEMGTGI